MRFFKKEWESCGWETDTFDSFVNIPDITLDSREMKEGWAFIAFDGTQHKGKDFVYEVLKKKPSAIFLDVKYKKNFRKIDETVLFFSSNLIDSVEQTIFVLFGRSSEKIILSGITGTNGKTSVALLLKNLVESLGSQTMYVGTLGAFIGHQKVLQGMTTPDMISMHRLIRKGIQNKIKFGFLEVSSHALEQGRVNGLHFSIGVFTNLSHDHLDYHKNMEDYYESKKILFKNMLTHNKTGTPHFVICIDDLYGQRLFEWLREEKTLKNILTFSLRKNSDLKVRNIKFSSSGYQCKFIFRGANYSLQSQLLGTFNLLNLACVFLVTYLLKFTPSSIIEKIAHLKSVKGRMEIVYQKKDRLIVIDYSHTPEALREALRSLQELNLKHIRVIFGCGGNRDQLKRPIMGAIASELADEIFITNDNPRDENPLIIAQQIEEGCKKNIDPQIFLDREKCIYKAISKLKRKEVLLIAGKGHEDYQIINNTKVYFSDHEIVKKGIAEYLN